MKKLLLFFMVMLTIGTINAQQIIDTVSLGAGYANQKWYSLQNGEQGAAPKDNWDIAFEIGGFGTSIHINSIIGTMLWTYPLADTSGWAGLDTTGINAWTPQYNSDTSWVFGAFDQNMVTTNANDVGWGIYNPITHIITGDSLFVIKLANGVYKKLWIKEIAGGGYNFQYADLDGSNLQIQSIQNSIYSGKNFGYFSIQTNTQLNREPVASANWDLLFTQYTAFIPTPYTVAGVLSNKGVRVAQADDVSNPQSYNNWSAHTFVTPINEIGSDWKAFAGGSWNLVSDTVYFVKSKTGDIWKLLFTGFGGSSTGNFIFSKEKLSTAGILEYNQSQSISLAIYPNPTQNNQVTLIYNIDKNYQNTYYTINDMSGRLVLSEALYSGSGLYQHTLLTQGLKQGLYIISMYVDGQVLQQKLIIE